MRFINPKTDFAFKRIFGSEENKEVLISFLNALVYENRDEIQDLRILNPNLAPELLGMKDTFVDVRAFLSNGSSVIIEMQVLNVDGFEKRVLYNTAKAYATQLTKGDSYESINPVIALTITDFVMFTEYNDHLSRYSLRERDHLTNYPTDDIQLVFAELPKFNKTEEELITLSDKWLYFMKNAPSLEMTPKSFEQVHALTTALSMANEANLTGDELDQIYRREIFIRDQIGAINKALKDGRREGMEKGMKKGMEKGMEKGRLEERIAIARNLLDVLDDETIRLKTGLTIEQIHDLRT